MFEFFIEPPSVYADRIARAGRGPVANPPKNGPTPPQPAAMSSSAYQTGVVMEILDMEHDQPLAITTLVNTAVRWCDHSSRGDRESRKLELFRLIGSLIKQGKLRRIARNYVIRVSEEEQKRRQEELIKAVQVDFPKPNV